jgi:uncharacterized protein YaeQ
LNNLQVIELAPETTDPLTALATRTMSLQCLVSDGDVQIIADESVVPVLRTVLK